MNKRSEIEAKAAAFELLAKVVVDKMPLGARIKKLAGAPLVEAIKDYVFVPQASVMVWHPVSEPVPERLHSSAMHFVPLLLAVPTLYTTPYRGSYLGGLIQAFRLDGSPSDYSDLVTHWMEMPPMP